ncbi:hypothetical protein C8F01DRAFT_1229301 [Mycena amicta]|nr:hypothetical protein C8F01DRAFT_1229301 [Mycena amicta]
MSRPLVEEWRSPQQQNCAFGQLLGRASDSSVYAYHYALRLVPRAHRGSTRQVRNPPQVTTPSGYSRIAIAVEQHWCWRWPDSAQVWTKMRSDLTNVGSELTEAVSWGGRNVSHRSGQEKKHGRGEPRHPRSAKLSKMTQSSATTAIRELEEVPTRPATEARINQAREYCFQVTRPSRRRPPPELIWRSLRSRDIASHATNILWKLEQCVPGGTLLGSYPRVRGAGNVCEVEETMDHVLFQYERTGQTEIWRLAKTPWLMGNDEWRPQSVGGLLSCALAEYQDGEIPAEAEVHNRWASVINERLKVDQTLATTYKNRRPLVDPQARLPRRGREGEQGSVGRLN